MGVLIDTPFVGMTGKVSGSDENHTADQAATYRAREIVIARLGTGHFGNPGPCGRGTAGGQI